MFHHAAVVPLICFRGSDLAREGPVSDRIAAGGRAPPAGGMGQTQTGAPPLFIPSVRAQRRAEAHNPYGAMDGLDTNERPTCTVASRRLLECSNGKWLNPDVKSFREHSSRRGG